MEVNSIGNIPNLSAEMENDISLMSINDPVSPVTILASATGSHSLPFNCNLDVMWMGKYNPNGLAQFIFSAPLTIQMTGYNDVYDNYSTSLEYVGCVIPWFLSQTCAYTELGSVIDCNVKFTLGQYMSGGDPDGYMLATSYTNVYTFSYMQFSYIYKCVAQYSASHHWATGSDYYSKPFGDITVIYANSVSKSMPHNGYSLYNDEI